MDSANRLQQTHNGTTHACSVPEHHEGEIHPRSRLMFSANDDAFVH